MAYPTVVSAIATQSSATTTWPPNTPTPSVSVGDLAVIGEVGNTTYQETAGPEYIAGGDAGWTQAPNSPAATGSDTGRIRIWYKVLTSSDIDTGTIKQVSLSTGSGSGKLIGAIFRHANLFDTADCLIEAIVQNANVSNGSTIATLTNVARAQVVLTFFWVTAGNNGVTYTWDGAGSGDKLNHVPYFDESSATTTTGGGTWSGGLPGTSGEHYGTATNQAQGDFWLYDTGDTPASINEAVALANTTHVAFTVNFKAKDTPATSGTATFVGGGTFTATGTVTKAGTATFGGAGTFTATGTRTVVGTASFDGGGTFTATQQGVTVVQGTASFAGGGTFTATGARVISGGATFAGGGTFTAGGTRTVNGTATFNGAGTFTAEQFTAATAYTVGGTWSSSTAVLPGGATSSGTATFSGGGTFSAAGSVISPLHGVGTFVGGDTFTAQGLRTVVGTASFDGGGTFSAAQFVAAGASATVTIRGQYSATVTAPQMSAEVT